MMTSSNFTIRAATEDDAAVILSLIKDLAEYEHLSHEVQATAEDIRQPSWANLGSIWKIFTSNRNTAATASVAGCWRISPGWQKSATAGDLNGRFWTGTNRPSAPMTG